MSLFDELDSLLVVFISLLFFFFFFSTRQEVLKWKESLTALTVSAILAAHITTANLLLQKLATVNLFSMSLSFACEFNTPMS
jgi:hypothetical protein